eukprot:269037_1
MLYQLHIKSSNIMWYGNKHISQSIQIHQSVINILVLLDTLLKFRKRNKSQISSIYIIILFATVSTFFIIMTYSNVIVIIFLFYCYIKYCLNGAINCAIVFA